MSFSDSRIARERAFFSQYRAVFAKRMRVCANSFCAVCVKSSFDHSNEIFETSHRVHSICQQVISLLSLSFSFFGEHRKKKKKQQRRRYRISRGGTVIPATKITQVVYPTVIPTPLSPRFLSYKGYSGVRGGKGATCFYWWDEDRTRRSVGSGIPLSFPLPSPRDPSRFLSKGTISVFKDPVVPSVSSSFVFAFARHFGGQSVG